MQAYEEKERAIAENKAKRKLALETELRSLKATIEDSCRVFDEALAKLNQVRPWTSGTTKSTHEEFLLTAIAISLPIQHF